MLEIRHVTKIYTVKGGAQTRALDDVSITFEDKGMVFLLGKSGSGKSTLLNVSGGLDEPTSGEVIVMGKSSKDFSGSDFDSYRNTFVGFIFQEYNILDEFNVEDNIALALELQGKSKDREKINSILREVELEEYAKRKPNTLSGGQKQRIAIARALVKDPQIIMADEPTGALDSATGRQVFETLKKLSKTRLVIVVSHDREFAETYGDRIVELKDGKIISDVTKTRVAPAVIDENITLVGGNTLSIKKGADIGSSLKAIGNFLADADGDIVVTKGQNEIAAFKKANRMTESGNTETFGRTETEKIKTREYSPSESKFIRSRLPARKAVRIGASGLKLKPVRLVFTILLSCIAFTFFGLMSTMMLYDGDAVLAKSFEQSSYTQLDLNKYYNIVVQSNYDDNYYTYNKGYSTYFTPDEVKKFDEKYGALGYYGLNYTDIGNVGENKSGNYYTPDLYYAAYAPEGNSFRNLIAGSYPQASDEICVSKYIFEAVKESGLYKTEYNQGKYEVGSEKVPVAEYGDLIGNYIYLSEDCCFKVTGIFDGGEIDGKYDVLKESSSYNLKYELRQVLLSSVHLCALVSESFYEYYLPTGLISAPKAYEKYFDSTDTMILRGYANGYSYDDAENIWKETPSYEIVYPTDASSVKGYDSVEGLITIPFGDEITSLADDEVMVNFGDLVYYREYIANILMESALREDPSAGEELLSAVYREADELITDYEKYSYGRYYVNDNCVYVSNEEREQALQDIKDILGSFGKTDVTLQAYGSDKIEFKLAGVYLIPYTANANSTGFIFSQNFIDENLNVYYDEDYTETTKFELTSDCVYTGILVNFDGRGDTVLKILSETGLENIGDNDAYYELDNSLYETVKTVNNTVDILWKVFLIAGLIFAVFAALLLFNFISMSISNKRKEIGILRAVGARGTDVFKIFFSEAGIIACICVVLAMAFAYAVCDILNGIIMEEIEIAVTLFVFGPLSALVMVGIAALVAVIATFLPVYFAARKKPVESIRAL